MNAKIQQVIVKNWGTLQGTNISSRCQSLCCNFDNLDLEKGLNQAN